MIWSTSGALICCDVACCSFAVIVGFVNPRPPSRAGSANISRVCIPGGGCPVSDGMKLTSSEMPGCHQVGFLPSLLPLEGSSIWPMGVGSICCMQLGFCDFAELFRFIYPTFHFSFDILTYK